MKRILREMDKEEKSVMLKVSEAYPRDAGRGTARIDTKTMRKLGVVSGDVIEIKGKNIADAVVWPGYSPDSNKSIIRIDRDIRGNTGVAIDDRVRVKKTTVKDAKRMPLATNVNLKELADKTEGFVGADIAALCKEAALHTIQRKHPKIETGKAIPPNELKKLKVTMGDFNEALTAIKEIR